EGGPAVVGSVASRLRGAAASGGRETPPPLGTGGDLVHDGRSRPALRLAGVSKAFGGVPVLTDSDVSVGAGQRVGIIGLNGAGKTTLFHAISGLRSEEHTSELQSPCNLVCRLLLEKKKKNTNYRAA